MTYQQPRRNFQHLSFFLSNSLSNNKKDVLLHRFCVTAYDGPLFGALMPR